MSENILDDATEAPFFKTTAVFCAGGTFGVTTPLT